MKGELLGAEKGIAGVIFQGGYKRSKRENISDAGNEL
jgi:hypothetical protein